MKRNELRRALAARDAFLAVVAQKLDGEVTALAAARGDERSRLVSRLQGFVRELRVIAEPERAVPLSRERLELVDTLGHWLRSFPVSQTKTDVHITGEAAVWGRWDRDHLQTIFGELLSNASKYGGGKPITITLARPTGAPPRVRLTVESAGTWSFPGGRFRYARFRRGETAPNVRGFGVGLWLTRRLAEAHGGTFRMVASGQRTRAIVSLPSTSVRGDLDGFRVVLVPRSPR